MVSCLVLDYVFGLLLTLCLFGVVLVDSLCFVYYCYCDVLLSLMWLLLGGLAL